MYLESAYLESLGFLETFFKAEPHRSRHPVGTPEIYLLVTLPLTEIYCLIEEARAISFFPIPPDLLAVLFYELPPRFVFFSYSHSRIFCRPTVLIQKGIRGRASVSLPVLSAS